MKRSHVAAVLVPILVLAAAAIGQGFAGDPQKPQAPSNLDLIGGLKQTKGCLGVETALTTSGKNVIFAWFANKEAVIAWYSSDTHQKAMATLVSGDFGDRTPLEQVSDDAGPILCIASITPAPAAKLKQIAMPVSQIAIELYQPLPGGVAIGGRFAPDAVAVPFLKSLPAQPDEAR